MWLAGVPKARLFFARPPPFCGTATGAVCERPPARSDVRLTHLRRRMAGECEAHEIPTDDEAGVDRCVPRALQYALHATTRTDVLRVCVHGARRK